MLTNIVYITFACCAVLHLMGALVSGVLARHRAQYLVLLWVFSIIFGVLGVVTCFSTEVVEGDPGLLNPYMLPMLAVGVFLQSLYSLGLVMPGFLQMERMLKYVAPLALLLCLMLALTISPGEQLTKVYSMSQLFREVTFGDMLLRFSALILGMYYLVNIFVLPFRFAKKTTFPVSMLVYSTVLVLSIVLYLYLAFEYNVVLLCGYVSMFTLLNLFWLFHSLETVVAHMRRPDISLEESERLAALAVAEEEKERAERERESKRQADFNEMNRQRYLRVQLWMQEHKELWVNNDFTRDRLCEETGINRQLMLQCLRSQGHYNVHEYITTYRVEELKRKVIRGEIATIAECDVVGFGSVQTARSCFARIEGSSLDAFFAEHATVNDKKTSEQK